MCLPINVVVGVILPVVVCPGVVFYEGARALGVGVTGWDWTVAILLTKAVGVRASVTAVSPSVAVPAVAVLGAGGSEVPKLVTGVATCPGLEVVWAVGTNMAYMTTHGAKVIHVNDWGGRGARWGVLQFRGSRAERELEEHSGGGGAGSVRDEGDIDGQRGGRVDGVRGGSMSLTLIRGVVTTFPPFPLSLHLRSIGPSPNPVSFSVQLPSCSPNRQSRHLPFHCHTFLRHHLPTWLSFILISDFDSLRLPSYLRYLL